MYAISSKISYLSRLLFLGVVLDLDKYIFPWQMCFFVGVILVLSRLEFG